MVRTATMYILLFPAFLAAPCLSQIPVGPRNYTGDQDQSSASWKPPAVTVAGLPSASANTGKMYLVTDATAPGNCTTGGGSTRNLCVSNGTSWVAIGDGTAAGGGDITAVGDCSTGDCFQSVSAGNIFAGPTSGSGIASFRSLADSDIPASIARDNEINVQGTANEISSSGSGPTPTLSISSTFRITGKTATAPIKTGTTPPATCSVGDYFYDTDAPAGQNTYACTAANTWTLQGDGNSGGDITAVGDCASGDCFQAAPANTVLASPNGSSGQASMRALVAADIPSLDASKITTGVFPAERGGTGNGFFQVTGPTGGVRTFTFPNSDATVLTTANLVTVSQGGTGISSGTSGGVPYFSATNSMASSGALAANTIVMGGGVGNPPTTAAGYTVQGAGTAGASVANAGTSTSLARSDHEHWVPWQAGVGIEQTPSASTYIPVPVPISASCGGSGSISVTKVSVTAVTKGTGNMTFNVSKCTADGTCANLFSTDQTYSSAGNNRQDFTPDQNSSSLNNTDYFRFFIGSSVNGQDDLSIVVSGKCKNI